ncbi:MAG: hypothetical protein ACOX0V_12110 [Bacteroidales bacterium]
MKIYQSWYHPDINITILNIAIVLLILFCAYVYGSRKSSNLWK